MKSMLDEQQRMAGKIIEAKIKVDQQEGERLHKAQQEADARIAQEHQQQQHQQQQQQQAVERQHQQQLQAIQEQKEHTENFHIAQQRSTMATIVKMQQQLAIQEATGDEKTMLFAQHHALLSQLIADNQVLIGELEAQRKLIENLSIQRGIPTGLNTPIHDESKNVSPHHNSLGLPSFSTSVMSHIESADIDDLASLAALMRRSSITGSQTSSAASIASSCVQDSQASSAASSVSTYVQVNNDTVPDTQLAGDANTDINGSG